MLDERHIAKLKGIYLDVLGMEVSQESATEEGMKLLSLMKAILECDVNTPISHKNHGETDDGMESCQESC